MLTLTVVLMTLESVADVDQPSKVMPVTVGGSTEPTFAVMRAHLYPHPSST